MPDGRHEQMKYAKDGSIVQLLPKHQGYAADLVRYMTCFDDPLAVQVYLQRLLRLYIRHRRWRE